MHIEMQSVLNLADEDGTFSVKRFMLADGSFTWFAQVYDADGEAGQFVELSRDQIQEAMQWFLTELNETA